MIANWERDNLMFEAVCTEGSTACNPKSQGTVDLTLHSAFDYYECIHCLQPEHLQKFLSTFNVTLETYLS